MVGLRFLNASFTMYIWLIPAANGGLQPEQAIRYVSSGMKRLPCKCELKLPGQSATSKFEITEYEANKKIVFVGEAAGPATPKGSFPFEPVPGGTKLTLLPRPEFRGFFKLLEPMMAGSIRKQNEEHLGNLKRLLES